MSTFPWFRVFGGITFLVIALGAFVNVPAWLLAIPAAIAGIALLAGK